MSEDAESEESAASEDLAASSGESQDETGD